MQYGSLVDMIDKSVRFYTGHLQVQKVGYWGERTLEYSMPFSSRQLQEFDDLATIEVAVPRVESFALSAYQNNTRAAMVFGVDIKREDVITNLSSKVSAGESIRGNEKAVMIGEGLAEYLKIKVGDTLVLISQGYRGINAAGLFPVKGIMKLTNPGQNKSMVAMPLSEAQYFYGLEDRVTSVAFLATDGSPLETAVAQVRHAVVEPELVVMDYQELIPELVNIMDMKTSSSRLMIMVLYAVISFGMFGTFLMMTQERIREYGIMLSLGMRKRRLQLMTFFEISMMSFFGVALGVLVSVIIIVYFYYNPIDLGSQYQQISEQYDMEIELVFSAAPRVFLEQAWAIIMITVILSFYPIIRLFKMKPVEARSIGL
jgi:ABC-type lipoprotein release transport system permease subunit